MLVDFTIENFRSYRRAKCFSLVASSSKELVENLTELPQLDLKLVRSAALYGANASGKSNLLAAMHGLGGLLDFPANRGFPLRFVFPPFLLDRRSAEKATRVRVRFLVEATLFEYSVALRDIVEEEHLIAYPHGRPQTWFHREKGQVDFNRTYLKGQKQSVQEMTPPDALLLAVAAMFGHPQLSAPARWLMTNLADRFRASEPRPGFSRGRPRSSERTARMCFEDRSFHAWVTAFLRHANLGIQQVEVEVTKEKLRAPVPKPAPEGLAVAPVQEYTVEHHEPYFIHSGDGGLTARFGLGAESHGTTRLFAMLPLIYQVLRDGELAVIDELSASIHPSLVREIVRVFHDPDLNPKGAQLVFATHDTSLLTGRLFRRDQVWFTEKSAIGATDLYSLHDIRDVREDEAFEKGYIRGRYGAIPFFGQFDFPAISEKAPDGAAQEA